MGWRNNKNKTPIGVDGWWMQDRDGNTARMVTLYQMPQAMRGSMRRLNLSASLTETKPKKDTTDVRLVFTATLAVDVDAADEELRAAFVQLMSDNVRNMSAPAAMLARKPPELSLNVTSRNGKEEIPLFGEHDEDHVKVR